MQNNKNKPGAKEGCQNINWDIGITAQGDIYIHFSNGDQHFRCAMDEHTAALMGDALKDAVAKKEAGTTFAQLAGDGGGPMDGGGKVQ